MDNIYDKKYASFMEQALHRMVQMPVAGICIVTKQSDGSLFTQYYRSDMIDKLSYAGVIQQDATLDILRSNDIVPPECGDQRHPYDALNTRTHIRTKNNSCYRA